MPEYYIASAQLQDQVQVPETVMTWPKRVLLSPLDHIQSLVGVYPKCNISILILFLWLSGLIIFPFSVDCLCFWIDIGNKAPL